MLKSLNVLSEVLNSNLVSKHFGTKRKSSKTVMKILQLGYIHLSQRLVFPNNSNIENPFGLLFTNKELNKFKWLYVTIYFFTKSYVLLIFNSNLLYPLVKEIIWPISSKPYITKSQTIWYIDYMHVLHIKMIIIYNA